MNGTATIILYDAATGAEISRTTESNMFTNAVRNILNPPLEALLHGYDHSKLFAGALPMWKNLLGGVMLLGNNEAEDADNILLGEDTVLVGAAGDAYSGTGVYRGSLNQNETYETENGYHFTWDFATDKANGEIRCVSLTSRFFGNTGFHQPAEKDGCFLICPSAVAQLNGISSMKFLSGHGQYIGCFDGMHWFMNMLSGGTLEFRKYRCLDPAALRINDRADIAVPNEPVETVTVAAPYHSYMEHLYYVDKPERKLHLFGNVCARVNGVSITIYHLTVDLVSMTASEEQPVLGMDFSANSKAGAVHKGHIFLDTGGSGVAEFDAGGTLVKLHDTGNITISRFFELNGMLMCTNSSTVYCLDMPGAPHSAHYTLDILPVCNAEPAPYVAIAPRSSHSLGAAPLVTAPALGIQSAYKATINNLAQPITKTSDMTMKIVYDITN